MVFSVTVVPSALLEVLAFRRPLLLVRLTAYGLLGIALLSFLHAWPRPPLSREEFLMAHVLEAQHDAWLSRAELRTQGWKWLAVAIVLAVFTSWQRG